LGLLPFVPFDSGSDLHQHFHRDGTDCAAQVVQDGGGGKFRNAGEVLTLQILRRVQTAAGQEGILDAGSHKIAKTHLQVEIVQLFQEAALGIIGKVP